MSTWLERGKRMFRVLARILFWPVLVIVVLFGYFNLPGPDPSDDIEFGMTFSARYATDLGLDWKATYLALLDDLGIRQLRIPVYWDIVERNRGAYDWSDLDWQLDEAAKRKAQVILTVGQRVPRWPECHIPEWALESDEFRKGAILKFVQDTVERYKERNEVIIWQVENEPFLEFFGECPPLDTELLDREIALVKRLDPTRAVLTTDSGELSLWARAAKRGDIFGTTLYRRIWSEQMGGYFTYPIGPNFFRAKEWLTKTLTDQDNFFVIELQAEPWTNGWLGNTSLEEQFKTMDEHMLRENVEYARQVGFPVVYLWGGEWWYWMKEKHKYSALWEEGKEIFHRK